MSTETVGPDTMGTLPEATFAAELDDPLSFRLSFVDGAYGGGQYTDLYLFAGDPGTIGRCPLRLRLFLTPRDAATLTGQLRMLAGMIEGRTPGVIATDGTVERLLTAGEKANPGFAYRLADGTPLMGPCDTEGCKYASKPGGARHDGECSNA